MEREELIRLRIVECDEQLGEAEKYANALMEKLASGYPLKGFPGEWDVVFMSVAFLYVEQLQDDGKFFRSLLEDHQDGQDHL